MLLVTWMLPVSSYVAHVLVYLPRIYISTNLIVTYIPNVLGTVVSYTYLTITCEVTVVDGCILAYMSKNVGSICPYNILAV